MNNEGSALNSSFGSISTIRPRNRRLISYNDEDDTIGTLDQEQSSSQARLAAPYSSRGASPVPRTHLPRPDVPSTRSRQLNGDTARRPSPGLAPTSPTSSLLGPGLWETSWSSLQGIASSLLNSDAVQAGHGGARSRSPMGMAQWRNASKASKIHTSQWGPKGESNYIAAGSQAERQALVQAKKREVLMRADADQIIDAKGKYKRRDSDGRQWSDINQQQAEDALVYIHRVKPDDTLAGVMIRYGCQPAVFRKVNRFWPNDNIQIREMVMLPVEACSVRGKKMDSDLMELVDNDIRESKEGSSATDPKPNTTISSPSLTHSDGKYEEPLWKHEYFVRMEGIPESVEIGRISRRTLGFFPPGRRKSVTFSDLGPSDDSRKPSLDLSQQTSNHAGLSMVRPDFDLPNGSPSRTSNPIRLSRHRSSSSASQNPHFLSRLRGPGGVGNLTGRTATVPGPEPDSLNRIFAPHLPNVEPPDSLAFLIEDDDGIGLHTSKASSTAGLENVGGAIEGWMRKVAGRVASSTSSARASNELQRKNAGWVPGGMGGDLIELGETPLEFQDDDREGILGMPQQSTSLDQERALRGRSPYKARGKDD